MNRNIGVSRPSVFPSTSVRRRVSGFSLLELAIIILLLGLITTVTWRFMVAQVQQQSAVATYSALERADWALTGFVMAHARLPCPDTDNDGIENCGGTAEVGTLPYQTLGFADARAGQIRYGVLRQTMAVPDPEASAADPMLALPRSVNLTKNTDDLFYPLVGILNNNITTEAALRAAAAGLGILPLQTLTTVSTPISARSTAVVTAFNIPLGEANALDFCYAIRTAEDPPPTDAEISNHVHIVTASGAARQVAYALALPGALDMSGDNTLFDGVNTGLSFSAPQQAQTYTNDDRVRAVSLGALWERLECGEAIAAIGHAQPNAATSAVMLYRILFDYEQILEQAYELAKAQYLMGVAGVVSSVGSIIAASASISNGVGDLALEGNPAGLIAGAAQMVAAIIGIAAAINAMVQAAEVQSMAKQRYLYAQILTASAKPLAENLLEHVRVNDARGLYFGKP